MRTIQTRSERLRGLAAEMAWKGGLLMSMACAMLAWAVALMSAGSLWSCLLFPAGLMAGLWGACFVAESKRVYRKAINEEQWEDLRRRAHLDGML